MPNNHWGEGGDQSTQVKVVPIRRPHRLTTFYYRFWKLSRRLIVGRRGNWMRPPFFLECLLFCCDFSALTLQPYVGYPSAQSELYTLMEAQILMPTDIRLPSMWRFLAARIRRSADPVHGKAFHFNTGLQFFCITQLLSTHLARAHHARWTLHWTQQFLAPTPTT